MKKTYNKPTFHVIEIQSEAMIATSDFDPHNPRNQAGGWLGGDLPEGWVPD